MKIKYKVNENLEYEFDNFEEFEEFKKIKKEQERFEIKMQYYRIQSQIKDLQEFLPKRR